MKKIIVFVTMVIIVIACSKQGTSIKVNKTKERYELVAAYPNRKTEKLEEYLKTVLGNGDIILREDIKTGKEIRLANSTIFYLRYNPGKLEMEMLLEKNNRTGYQYFDEMAKGIKAAIY
ncbi:MAG: hypothetical protein EOO43_25190 [Flavobacterium sp.]|nr:MAG: hypothetical protein EOO43_25190 [Flavobacterium sp.]